MKTLADVKRRIQVGTSVRLMFAASWREPVPPEGLPGVVTIRQSNAFATLRPGKDRPSWLTWPKAADLRITGPDTFDVLEGGKIVLSYRIDTV